MAAEQCYTESYNSGSDSPLGTGKDALLDFFCCRLLLKRYRKHNGEGTNSPQLSSASSSSSFPGSQTPEVVLCIDGYEALVDRALEEWNSLAEHPKELCAVQWAEHCWAFSNDWLSYCHWVCPGKFRDSLTKHAGVVWKNEADVAQEHLQPPIDLKSYKNPQGSAAVSQVCHLCKVPCNSLAQYKAHIQGRTHRALARSQPQQGRQAQSTPPCEDVIRGTPIVPSYYTNPGQRQKVSLSVATKQPCEHDAVSPPVSSSTDAAASPQLCSPCSTEHFVGEGEGDLLDDIRKLFEEAESPIMSPTASGWGQLSQPCLPADPYLFERALAKGRTTPEEKVSLARLTAMVVRSDVDALLRVCEQHADFQQLSAATAQLTPGMATEIERLARSVVEMCTTCTLGCTLVPALTRLCIAMYTANVGGGYFTDSLFVSLYQAAGSPSELTAPIVQLISVLAKLSPLGASVVKRTYCTLNGGGDKPLLPTERHTPRHTMWKAPYPAVGRVL